MCKYVLYIFTHLSSARCSFLCLPSVIAGEIMQKLMRNISSMLEQILILRISVTAELTVLFF